MAASAAGGPARNEHDTGLEVQWSVVVQAGNDPPGPPGILKPAMPEFG